MSSPKKRYSFLLSIILIFCFIIPFSLASQESTHISSYGIINYLPSPTPENIAYEVYRIASTYYADAQFVGGTNYSGSDFVTVLENALGDCPSGDAVFIRGPDIYMVDGPINPPADSIITCPETESERATLESTTNYEMFSIFQIEDVSNIIIENLFLQMHATSDIDTRAINVLNSPNCKIHNVVFRGARTAINPSNSPYLEIIGCDFLMTVKHSAIWGNGNHYMKIWNNTIVVDSDYYRVQGIGALEGSRNMNIAYNNISGWSNGESNEGHGIYIGAGCDGSVIHHNEIHSPKYVSTSGYGIQCKSGGCTFEYNYLHHLGKGLTVCECTAGGNDVIIRHNTFEGLHPEQQGSAILVYSGQGPINDMVIQNNTFTNFTSGIQATGGGTDMRRYEIAYNAIYCNSYGIYLHSYGGSNITDFDVHHNTVLGHTAYDLFNDADPSNIQHDNVYDTISWLT